MPNAPDMNALLSLLAQIVTAQTPLTPATELLESGLLDSLALVELLDRLEDTWGAELYPSRLPRETFATPENILAALLANEPD